MPVVVMPKPGGPGAAGGLGRGLVPIGGTPAAAPSASLGAVPGASTSSPGIPGATAPTTGKPAGYVEPDSRSAPNSGLGSYASSPPMTAPGATPPSTTVQPTSPPTTVPGAPQWRPDASGVLPPPSMQAPPLPPAAVAAPPPAAAAPPPPTPAPVAASVPSPAGYDRREQLAQEVISAMSGPASAKTMDAGSVADAPVQQAEAPPPASAGAEDSPAGVAETAPASGQVGAQNNPIKSIPDHGDTDTWIQWLKDNGFFTDAQVKKDFEQLASNLAKYYDPNSTKSDPKVMSKIDKNLRQLEKAGIYIDREAVINSYGTPAPSGGGGTGGGGDGGGDGGGGTGGTGDGGGGDGGTTPPDSGYDLWQLGNLNDLEKADIFKKIAGGDPDAAKAWEAMFEYLKWQEGNSNQQTAVDTYAQYADFLKNNPSFQGIDEWIANGPNMTLTPEDIERMKTSGREMYGQGLTSLDQQIRQQAAASGVPTSDLGGIQARARAGLLSGLMGNERGIDLQAAEMNAADEALYYQQMLAGAQTTAAPWAQYYGGLSGLISGTPGLAGTGNPFAGLSDYNLMRQEQQEGLSGYDRRGLIGSEVGTWLNLGGQVAGMAAGAGA